MYSSEPVINLYFVHKSITNKLSMLISLTQIVHIARISLVTTPYNGVAIGMFFDKDTPF